MRRSPTNFPVITTAVLGFLAMAALGWNLGGESAPAATGENVPPATRSSHPRMVRSGGPTADAQKRLAPLRAARDEAGRMHAAIEIAGSIPVSDITAWLDGAWFSQREGAANILFHKILLERWQQEDPAAFLAWTLKNKRGDAYNFLVATADPQRALDFFKANPDDGSEMRILIEIAKSNPAIALRRLQEMAADASPQISSYAHGLLKEIAKKSPAELEAALDSLPADLKKQAEVVLTGQKMTTDFAGEFEKLRDRPDGIDFLRNVLNSEESLYAKIPGVLADFPDSWKMEISNNANTFVGRENTEAWLKLDLEAAGFTAGQAEDIRIAALGRMINLKPEAGLKLLDEMNFPAEARGMMIKAAFEGAARNNIPTDTLLALLDTDADREAARRVMEVAEQRKLPLIEQPAAWLEKLAAFDFKQRSANDYYSMLRNWDSEKLAALHHQFRNLPDESKRPLAKQFAISGNLDPSLRGESIRYILANPADEPSPDPADPFAKNPSITDIQVASRHIAGLARTDPTAAGEWVSSLPDGDPKLWAQKNLHRLWSQYDPQAADKWLDALPTATQAEVLKIAK